MWKTITSHVKFCWRAISQDYRKYGVVKKAYLITTFLVITVLGTIFGQSIWQLFNYLRPLLGVRGWIIVAVAILTVFLVYLVTAIQRFHEQIVRRVIALSLARGQGIQLLKGVAGGEVLHRDDLNRWKSHICQAFYEGFDMTTAIALQEDWPPVTENIDEQSHWINDRLREIDRLIEKERGSPIPYVMLY